MNFLAKGLGFLFSSMSSSSSNNEEEEVVLSIEEEKDEMPQQKKREKEESSSSSASQEKPAIDLPKATDRMKRSNKATFEVENGELVVSVPKGKRTKAYRFPYIESPDEQIIQQLKDAMDEYNLDYMNAIQAAMYAPAVFWNSIYHWKTFYALEEKLLEAGVPNGQRRTRQKR